MEKTLKISLLMDLYGPLLTDKQRDVLDQYYNLDLSLSEIAENQKTSRQGVHDIVRRTYNNLIDYEDKLNLLEKLIKKEKVKKRLIKELTSKNYDLNNITKQINEL
ncbi:MAG: putative DNA-binding protein [Clostridium sp.]|nr:putative DNA-binding protein [Clostridium sp.]